MSSRDDEDGQRPSEPQQDKAEPDPAEGPAESETAELEDTDREVIAEAAAGAAQRRARRRFPVVGIGASAGGLDALKLLMRELPPNTGLAFVVIQHLDPNHESMMADLLARHTAMTVTQAEDATPLIPNTVYLIPPGKYLRIADGGLFLDEPVQRRGMRMPIDHFFRSLAEAQHEMGIGIVVSGTGSDGAQGIREIKGSGGLTLAQTPESAEYDGMPRAAIGTGMVDMILDIAEMPAALLQYARHPYVAGETAPSGLSDTAPEAFEQVIRLLRTHTGYNFRNYKTGTLNRRIQRRMSLYRCATLDEYVDQLRESSTEVQALFKDLLISVTRFFRDAEAWEAMAAEVIPALVRNKSTGETVRIWVPGCATGEEAYSLAMLLSEEIERQFAAIEIQIFATDIDDDAIAVARDGSYPDSIQQDVSPERLRRFFVEEKGRYRVIKRLRQMTVFAVQNLIGDPPFSNLDLISCRNLMIYLDNTVQSQVMDIARFALVKDGYLFLGTSESLGRHQEYFEPVAAPERIFRKLDHPVRPGQGRLPIQFQTGPRRDPARRPRGRAEDEAGGWSDTLRRGILKAAVPPGVVIDRRQEIQFVHGDVSPFLALPPGEPARQLLQYLPDANRPKMRVSLNRAIHGGDVVSDVLVGLRKEGAVRDVRFTVRPLLVNEESDGHFLVTFEEEPVRAGGGAPTPPASEEERSALSQLEYELSATREDLQSTIEELESSNEELKASNEEVMSMNEELQSTNEELETSREELQSLNEELSTVNNQLEDKVSELQGTNDDLTNLLSSTDVATVFLDTDLCIRRFTPATTRLLNVRDADVGRPLSDLSATTDDPGLLTDARAVLETLHPSVAEIAGFENLSFMRRVTPYRTAKNSIEGVVVTYTDVTSLKDATGRLARRERQQAAIARLGLAATTLDADPDALLAQAVSALADLMDVRFAKAMELDPSGSEFRVRAGVGWEEGVVGHAIVPTGSSQAGYTLQSASPVIVRDLSKELRFTAPDLLVRHGIVSGLSTVVGPIDRPWGILSVHSETVRDFSTDDLNFLQAIANVIWETLERKRIEAEKRLVAQRLEVAIEAGRMATYEWEVDTGEAEWTRGFYQLLGYEPGAVQASTESWRARVYDEDLPRVEALLKEALAGDGDFEAEYRVCPAPGKPRWVMARGRTGFRPNGTPERMFGVVIDIQEQKEAEAQKEMLLRELDHRVKNILANIQALARQTAADAKDVAGFVQEFSGRVEAIARAHSRLSSSQWAGVDLAELVDEELAAYRRTGRPEIAVEGPPVMLAPETAQMMAMAVHELATNAVKYGPLGNGNGRLEVRWHFAEGEEGREVRFRWQETGGPPCKAPEATGFGTLVLSQFLPAQMSGTAKLDFPEEGFVFDLCFPFAEEDPDPADEEEAPEAPSEPSAGRPLDGARILVVEDSPLTAFDIYELLRSEGAAPLEPVATVAAALGLVEQGAVDAAVLDRNLGREFSDPVAERLIEKGLPFLFLTGYGAAGLPDRFRHIPVESKPFHSASLLRRLRGVLSRGPETP